MEIGGYFELEISTGNRRFHRTPYQLKSGRSALAFILQVVKPAQVHVPFYTCNALLEPLISANVKYSFYHINSQLEMVELPVLKSNELIIYINYYDVKRNYAERLSKHYGDQLIIDCTQSFFLQGNQRSWYFNSSRKFFGVPDGADLYAPEGYDLSQAYRLLRPNKEFHTEHLISRFNGDTQKGYPVFVENEKLNGKGVHKISELSASILSNVNYKRACEARQRNFRHLHQQLAGTNLLTIADPFSPAPSFYPYLPERKFDKKAFWDNQLYIPIFWNDCMTRDDADSFDTEVTISDCIIPIPVDHRYKPGDFDRLLQILL